MTDDDQLHRLFSDAVSDIEPHDRIDQLRAKVHPSPKVVPMARPRSWYAMAGIVATAAVIGVIAYLTSVAGDKATDLGPSGNGGTALPTTIATDTEEPQPGDGARPKLTDLPVYYVGHSARGDVLFRQDTLVSSTTPRLVSAVTRLMASPYDPDYRLGWSPGWLVSAEIRDGVIQVQLGSAPATRPARMSARTAYEIVQSAVYTLQAAAGSDAEVSFLRGGLRVPAVLGVPTGHPLAPGQASDVLSRVDITHPAVDGLRRGGTRLVVTGTEADPLGRVVVRLVRTHDAGGRCVRLRTVRAGTTPDAADRYQWRVVLDTSSLRPGQYTVVARSAGHGGESDTDTRVVVLP
jgi:hypothetical protein